MKKVYEKRDSTSPETIEEILESEYGLIKKSTTMDASSTTFKEAVCAKKYRKASSVAFFLNIFNQLAGINGIFVYSNRLFKQMSEQGGD